MEILITSIEKKKWFHINQNILENMQKLTSCRKPQKSVRPITELPTTTSVRMFLFLSAILGRGNVPPPVVMKVPDLVLQHTLRFENILHGSLLRKARLLFPQRDISFGSGFLAESNTSLFYTLVYLNRHQEQNVQFKQDINYQKCCLLVKQQDIFLIHLFFFCHPLHSNNHTVICF